MINRLNGEVPLRIGGRECVLRFGWAELISLQAALGEEDFDTKIAKAIAALDLQTLAIVLAIGLRGSWPDVTAEAIIKESPPLAQVTAAISLALRYSFHGIGEVADQPPENPRKERWVRRALRKLTSLWKR